MIAKGIGVITYTGTQGEGYGARMILSTKNNFCFYIYLAPTVCQACDESGDAFVK